MVRGKTSKGKNGIFQQSNRSALLGGIKVVAQSAMFYVTALNFVMLIWLSIQDTTLSVVLREFGAKYVPWFNFPIFLAIAIGLLLIAMWVEYKYIIPSTWAFQNWQFYAHRNPMRSDVLKVLSNQESIDERLSAIEDKLGVERKKSEGEEKQ
jgi:hypothetical protein